MGSFFRFLFFFLFFLEHLQKVIFLFLFLCPFFEFFPEHEPPIMSPNYNQQSGTFKVASLGRLGVRYFVKSTFDSSSPAIVSDKTFRSRSGIVHS